MRARVELASLVLVVLAMTTASCEAAAKSGGVGDNGGVHGGVPFAPENCGDVTMLSAERGVIHTPNFPGRFATPIRCRWVIFNEAAAAAVGGGDGGVGGRATEIYVYLTQLFVKSGLRISRSRVYLEETQTAYLNETLLDLAHVDMEEELVDVVWTSGHPYVVIDFKLDRLEGNHLRVERQLMDVYGFNITYEIAEAGRNESRCTVIDCSMLGHCYASADFSNYSCSCFEGFSGRNCGDGPLCHPKENYCSNGATCRQAGETIAYCICTEGFTGPRCEVPIVLTLTNVTSPLIHDIQCEFNETTHQKEAPCTNCQNQIKIYNIEDRAHYFLNIHRASSSTSSPENASLLIRKEIELSFYHQNLTVESIKSLNTLYNSDMIQIERYHFYANSSEENSIRVIVDAILKNNSWNNAFTLQKEPSLYLQTVSTNMHKNVVRENEEFILTCVARGSSSLIFQWYKDDIPINVSLAVRGMWLEMVPNEDDIHRSILGVERAQSYDNGIYTCQVKDWGLQQCKSVNVDVLPIPRVKMLPLNIVAERGENVSIQCCAENAFAGTAGGGVGYMWTRNGEAVKMEAPRLYYEELYRKRSILYVNDVQKSETFGCNGATVRIDILDKDRTPFCQNEDPWSVTGAGVTALQECPDNYSNNVVKRLCSMVDEKKAKWDVADFSECISDSFFAITENFHKMTLGYQNDSVTVTNTLSELHQWLSRRQRTKLVLPGEGESIVTFLQMICDFSVKTNKWSDFYGASIYFYQIVDVILQNPSSILNLEKVFRLSTLIEKWSSLLALINKNRFNSTFSSFEYHLPQLFGQFAELYPDISIRVDGSGYPKSSTPVTVMIYKNLSFRLLPSYGFVQSKNGEQTYELSSPIVHVLLSDLPKIQNSNSSWFVIDVKFKLPFHKSVCCGLVASFGRKWDLDPCIGQPMVSANVIQCSCNHSGMVALFTSDLRMVDSNAYKKYHIVMIGCAFCFLLCVITLCALLFRWFTIRSCLMYLKIQICASTAAAMLLFFYGSCDPSLDTYAYILSGLQMFLFISVSSHISILIVMYIDIISLKNIPNIKVSAISVMTVSPMLLIVFTPISRQMTNEGELKSWWLCKRTLLFYIHIMLGLFFLLLFIFLYYSVMKKLLFLWKCTKVERRIIVQRISFLQYTLIIFVTTAVMVISSTVYVNVKSFTSQCVFGSSCTLLGFVIFICYFPQNEVSFCFKIMFPILKHSDTKYSPELQVIASHSGIIEIDESYETESSSHSSQSFEKSEKVHFQAEDIKHSSPKETEFENQPELIPIAELDREPSTEGQHAALMEPVIPESSVPPDKEAKPEPDILWPITKNNYISTSSCQEGAKCCSPPRPKRPEILTTRVCVELGVLKNGDSHNSLGDGSPSTVVICNVDVEPCPGHMIELNEVKFTTNAIGSLCPDSIAQKVVPVPALGNTPSTETNGDKTDVLDRISQDLDYLLNRSPSPSTKARRARVSVGSPQVACRSVNKSAKSNM